MCFSRFRTSQNMRLLMKNYFKYVDSGIQPWPWREQPHIWRCEAQFCRQNTFFLLIKVELIATADFIFL